MKIEPTGPNHVSLDRLEASRKAEAARAAAPGADRDQAALSERAVLLSKAKGALEAVPEVRIERVTSLKHQVEAGLYQVPYEGLATRLLAQKIVE